MLLIVLCCLIMQQTTSDDQKKIRAENWESIIKSIEEQKQNDEFLNYLLAEPKQTV